MDVEVHAFVCAAGYLSAKERNSYLVLLRNLEVSGKRTLYSWFDRASDEPNAMKGFPGFISAGSDITELPHDLRLADMKAFETDWSKHNAAATSCAFDVIDAS